jgi:hypothetical protein
MSYGSEVIVTNGSITFLEFSHVEVHSCGDYIDNLLDALGIEE